MPITLDDLNEQRRKIAESRKKLEEQEAALRVLESMIAESEPNSAPQRQIDLGVLPSIEPRKKSLVVLVQEVVQRLGTQEFTVAHIESVLEGQGTLPKSKTPRASIAMALQKLEKDGEVIRTHRGVGSEPHRYKNKPLKLHKGFGGK